MGNVAYTVTSQSGEQNVPRTYGSPRDIGKNILQTVTMSASYAAGGDTLDFSQFFPLIVLRGRVSQFGTGQPSKYHGCLIPGATPQTNLLKVVDSTTGSEVSAATNLSGVQFLVEAWGE